MRDKTEKQRGYFTFLAVLLGLVIVMMSSVFILPGTTAWIRSENQRRTAAVFAAQEQIAEIEHLGHKGELSSGRYDFLGKPEDLLQHGKDFSVYTEVEKDEKGWNSVTYVTWESRGTKKSLTFQRWVAPLEKMDK